MSKENIVFRSLPITPHRPLLPGFAPALGTTLLWTGLLVALPLSALALRPWEHGPGAMLHVLTGDRVRAALALSFGAAALAATIALGLGLVLAWALARGPRSGPLAAVRRGLDLLIDLPFALPTAVSGIALATLYGPRGWFGAPLHELGIDIAYTRAGIEVALVFVSLPFAVRAVEPVLAALPAAREEAAESLGATHLQVLARIVLPALRPALLAAYALAFARALGEYGSVIFIAGNMPGRSEIAPLLIVIRLQEFDEASAAAIGLLMLLGAALCLAALSAARRALR
ncbi:sulfate transport system permease protein [Endobacter medicaginis]|uniref:Sulfate transport system permease protein CysT n=3 Tax=Endobacter medicaginis TaxID=1181271 RepID=A0A839UU26_9PROT|nr:sulfate ABC transporter permease subunit CysT [Endobacter medicaginis]MBB3173768.1 sulfate transport system permease protein [Endobacter medicaginis]